MFPPGVRSPPLRGVDYPRARWPCGASPGITREVVFSEGRGLRAHTARHHGLRKVSSMGEDRREAGCPRGICLGQAGALFAGVRSPSLRGVDHPRARRPYGGKPGDDAKGGFLGGTHSVRPLSMAERVPRDFVPPGMRRREAGCPRGICLGQAGAFLSGRAEPAPPLDGQSMVKGLGWQALGWRQRGFSRRDALRASA